MAPARGRPRHGDLAFRQRRRRERPRWPVVMSAATAAARHQQYYGHHASTPHAHIEIEAMPARNMPCRHAQTRFTLSEENHKRHQKVISSAARKRTPRTPITPRSVRPSRHATGRASIASANGAPKRMLPPPSATSRRASNRRLLRGGSSRATNTHTCRHSPINQKNVINPGNNQPTSPNELGAGCKGSAGKVGTNKAGVIRINGITAPHTITTESINNSNQQTGGGARRGNVCIIQPT